MESNRTTNVSHEFTYNIMPPTIICVLGVASNALLMIAFITDPLKCFRNSGTYLVINLSVSDCLMCLIAPFYLALRNEIVKNVSFLLTIEYIAFCFGLASFVTITSISIDRFFVVALPIKHRILMKGKLIIMWLAAIWIVSCFISVLQLLHIHGTKLAHSFVVISIILSTVMYSSTYYNLKKQSRTLAGIISNESRAQEIRILKEKRFCKTIIIISCVSFVCIVPYMIFYLNYDALSLSKENLTSEVIGTASLLILYINHAVNPLIYILRLQNYRKTFFLLYCRIRTFCS